MARGMRIGFPVTSNPIIIGERGNYSIAGQEVGLFHHARITAESGSYTIFGQAANLIAPSEGIANLTWTASSTPGVTGYRVYYGNSPGTYLQPFGTGINVGTATSHQVIGLTNGTWYFAVTARNASEEGPYSNEVSKVIT